MNEIRSFGEGPEIRIFLYVRKVDKRFFARFQPSGIGLTATCLTIGNVSRVKKSGLFPVILLDSIKLDVFFRISGISHRGQGSQKRLSLCQTYALVAFS